MRSFVERCILSRIALVINLKIHKIIITNHTRDLDCKSNKYLR